MCPLCKIRDSVYLSGWAGYLARSIAASDAAPPVSMPSSKEFNLGTKKSGKGRRKLGRKKRRMRSKIRHRKK